MAPTLTQTLFIIVVLFLPQAVLAESSLVYQNRGDRFEGVRPKPVSGYNIELISVLADYQEPASQLPDHLRVGFYLQRQTPVHLTVREQDYRLYYWLDRVKPTKEWQAGSVNEYMWPTEPVLGQLDQKFNPYELGILVRLGRDTPAENEEIAPAILYHANPPERVNGYLFTMKTNGDARLSCKVLRGKGQTELMTQAFRRLPGGQPFTVRWNTKSAQEGHYSLVCSGYFLDTNEALRQSVRFFHRPTAQ